LTEYASKETEKEFNMVIHLNKIVEMILSSSGYAIVENVEKLDTVVDALGWKGETFKEELDKIKPDINNQKYKGMGASQFFFTDLALAKFQILYKIIHTQLGDLGTVGGTEEFEHEFDVEVVEDKKGGEENVKD